MKTFSKRVLDTTVHDIWFDEQVKCKYCYLQDEMGKLHPQDGGEK